MENLILGAEKHLGFPYEEFQKYFKNYPSGFLKEVIIDNALACYCSLLVFSLVHKKNIPSFEKPKLKIIYSFKKFEINHLKLLNNVNKFKLLKTSLKGLKLDDFLLKGYLDFKMTPLLKDNIDDSKLIIEIDLKLTKIKIPKAKTEILIFFKMLYKSIVRVLSKEKNAQNFSIKPQAVFDVNVAKICVPILNLPKMSFSMDILVCIFNLWMQNDSSDFMLFCVDDILRLRGIKKLNTKTIRSGYKNSTRDKIKEELLKFNDKILFEDFVWADDEDRKRASNLSWAGEISLFEVNTWGFENDYYFIARPTAFMLDLIKRKSYFTINSVVLSYHSHNFSLEKKAAYFLMKKLKNKIDVEIKINELIKLLYAQETFEKPSKIRDRLENILDRLVDDKIIKYWHYKKIDEKIFSKKHWTQKWFELKVLIGKN